jgi:general secretion pathway protein D
MILKSNFHQNNKKIFSLILLICFAVFPLYATNNKSCEYRAFSIKTNSRVSSLDLLSQIADSCDFTIIIKDNFARDILKKNLDGVNIKDLSLNELFKLFIGENDLYYTFDKDFLKISSLKTKIFNLDYITSIRNGTAILNASVDSATGGNGDNIVTSKDTFNFWDDISNELLSVLNVSKNGYQAEKPIINQNAGIITITATKEQLDRVGKYINTLKERLHKQVLIDVSILSVNLKHSSSRGIDWSNFKLSLSNNLNYNINGAGTSPLKSLNYTNAYTVVSKNAFTMTGLVDFLATYGTTKTISSPKVLTMNNQQALITIGDNINYRIQTDRDEDDNGKVTIKYENDKIFIGVLLNITPEISNNNEIILRINPSVSNFKYAADNAKQDLIRVIAPDTSEKKLSTVVRIKDGSTIILGGLITNSKGKENSKVPLLGDIPLLGNAFKHTADSLSSQELIFVITPKIIGVNGTTKASLRDLGFSKRLYE